MSKLDGGKGKEEEEKRKKKKGKKKGERDQQRDHGHRLQDYTYTQDKGACGGDSEEDDAVDTEEALDRLRPKRLNEGDRVERRRTDNEDDGWSPTMDKERRGFSVSMVSDGRVAGRAVSGDGDVGKDNETRERQEREILASVYEEQRVVQPLSIFCNLSNPGENGVPRRIKNNSPRLRLG